MAYNYNLGLAFYEVARRFAGRPAIVYPDKVVHTYADINGLSNQIARYLAAEGLHKGDVLAIFNNKSVTAYSLMLACIKSGIIYTNLDDTSPWERIQKILNTCQATAVFFDKNDATLAGLISGQKFVKRVVDLNAPETRDKITSQPTSDLEETFAVTGADPVYIMFTSGSTGFPKGAVMSHSNVLHFIQWGQTTFGVSETDIMTNANPIYFDNSVFDFYVSLFNGASLVPLTADVVKTPKTLVQAINNSGCTIWFSVPSLLVYLLTTKALTTKDFPTIKRIAFGGEGFPKNRLKQLYDLFGDRVTLYNVYGPTECTCICSSYVVTADDFNNMSELAPLGFMAPNFDYEIISTDGDPNKGELALIGPCVGLGYYNDPERTAKLFVQNPNRVFFQRMYKTGDLVYRAPNGHLHFRGRVDNQIKHMGYRIELEEIEAAFATLSYINEAGVIYEKITAELGQIKAFVSVSDKSLNPDAIQENIRAILPPYMVPKIVILDVLPKNQNGKIDRRQLTNIGKS